MIENKPGKNNRKRRVYKLKIPDLPCFYCGICCAKFQAQLNSASARVLADNMGIDWERFLAEYIDRRWPGTQSFLIRQVNGSCVFLCSVDNRNRSLCAIQAFKPSSCREWMPGISQPECLEGLKRSWGLTVNPSGEICGDRENIEAFEKFIYELKNLS